MSSLESVVERLRACKKVLIVSGAGISVSCGIPDFRSKEGLYNTLDCTRFGIPSAELIFDYEFFKIDPDPFFRFSSVLLPKKNSSRVHRTTSSTAWTFARSCSSSTRRILTV